MRRFGVPVRLRRSAALVVLAAGSPAVLLPAVGGAPLTSPASASVPVPDTAWGQPDPARLPAYRRVIPEPPAPVHRAARQRHRERASRSELRSALPPRVVGRVLAARRGWTGSQFSCLDLLWTRESNWRVDADNAASSAYGIPQALPGTKMASAGPDWRTDAATQIRWGLRYIAAAYGSPCGAWSHSEAYGYY